MAATLTQVGAASELDVSLRPALGCSRTVLLEEALTITPSLSWVLGFFLRLSQALFEQGACL